MNLRSVHFCFIIAAAVAMISLAMWAFLQYQAAGSIYLLSYFFGGLFACIGLIVYGIYFLKRSKAKGIL